MSEAAHLVQYIVVPYRAAANGVAPGEIRPASSEFGAIRIANSMASKFAGVAAYEVMIDKETGDMESPRILARSAPCRRWTTDPSPFPSPQTEAPPAPHCGAGGAWAFGQADSS